MQQGKLLLSQINKARKNPQGCISDIKQQISRFQSNTIMRTKKGEKLKVSDGKAAWQQAILFLQQTKPKEPLQWSAPLSQIAAKFNSLKQSLQDINPFKLLKQKYSYEGSISFNVNQSQIDQNLRELVILMIIGDGDEKKGNRSTIFQSNYTHFGCSIARKSNKNYYMHVSMFFSQSGVFNFNTNKELQNVPKSNFVSKITYIERGKQFFAQLNKIRKQPKNLIPALKSDIQKFTQQKTIIKDNIAIKTKEGKSAYYDIINQLQQQFPIPILKFSQALSIACAEQVQELQQRQQSQKNLTNYQVFVKKYAVSSDGINNIIMNRSQNDSYTNMLILLLVGDGDKKRLARRRLLSPVLKVFGAAIGQTYFTINIGEIVKDNKLEIENYYQRETKISNQIRKQKQLKIQPNKVSAQKKSEGPKLKQQNQQKTIKKKTTKSSTFIRNGLHYKKIHTKIIYMDGEIDQQEEQQLIQ